MFKKILVANRGEIAVRIIRGCKELNIPVIAIYSTVDKDSYHVKLADEAYCVGPADMGNSYLNKTNVITTAKKAGADAIHPGYGFLAENSEFARLCQQEGITFIGPSAEAIDKMGDKSEGIKSVKEAGVPCVPGTQGELKDLEEARELAGSIGYPVLIKAAAGGGGKGMRVCETEQELKENFDNASREAQAAFGNSSMYLEKYITCPRHVEIQVFCDQYGNGIHFGERDCSIQRRHQKLIEEAPSPALDENLRRRMGEAALKAAKSVDYVNAGTVEFLLDEDRNFYFIEMNTRIQVEHPVTEMVTGVDLVKLQIIVASGEPLPVKGKGISPGGHAIECRINAEDPGNNFIPTPGKIKKFNLPGGPGVRIDSGFLVDSDILPFYDSMVSKLITWGKDREEAINRMKRALGEFEIEGIKTTVPLHKEILANKEFLGGNYTTNFIEEEEIVKNL